MSPSRGARQRLTPTGKYYSHGFTQTAARRSAPTAYGHPVYITHDTFSGNTCSNGAALSGLYANFDVTNSLLTANKAIGWGGTLRIEYSTLDDNPSGVFQNTPGIFDSVDATTPRRSWSTRRSAEPGELLWPHAGRRRSAAMSL